MVIPGINPNALSSLADQVSGTGLLGLLDIFSMESCPYPAEDIPRNIYGKKKKRKGRKGPRIN